MVHPFDDPALIAGQGTLGMEIADDCPSADVVVVPIGGGLISGASSAVAAMIPSARVIGDGAAMQASLGAGRRVTLEDCGTVIDGLRVKTVGANTFEIVRRLVQEVVEIPDRDIFAAVVRLMARCKLVAEGRPQLRSPRCSPASSVPSRARRWFSCSLAATST